MIEETQNRLAGVLAKREQCQEEIKNIDTIVKEAEALAEALTKMENHSYIIRESFGVK